MNNTIYQQLNVKKIEKIEGKVFSSFFSSDEYNDIMSFYFIDKSKRLYDGSTFRIDEIKHERDGDIITISNISFYDYMTSNILLVNEKGIIDYLENINKKTLIKKINEFVDECKKLKNTEEILENIHLSNLASVSLLIKDKNQRYGIIKRGRNTAVSSGFYSVTSTGCIEEVDFNNSNPFVGTCLRELGEELDIFLEPEKIKVNGVVFDKNKLQPVILCDSEIDDVWENLVEKTMKGKDYNLEVAEFFSVSENELPNYISAEKMTEASKVHIQLNCKVRMFDYSFEKNCL